MKLNVFALAGLLVCGLSAAPATGTEGNGRLDEEAVEDMALLELYFGEDQLVEAATRYPKPVSQVAENVTIITADEIEAMHAHTVAEVLERAPGVFVQFNGRDFASRASLHIHGSWYEHVLVLVDGIRWNYVSSDFAETNNIPVEIIDRIEVIKGAASSAWGSALGGVVNIITKKTGNTARPHGSALIGLGEHDTRHYYGEAAGGLHDFGYYLYAGRRESDGLRDDRFFDAKSLFAKFSYNQHPRTLIGGEIGYSQPENRYINYDPWDFAATADERLLFYAVDLDHTLTDQMHFYLQFYGRDQRFTNLENLISTGEAFNKRTYNEEQRGASSRLVWEKGRHLAVLGAEYLYRENTDRDDLAVLSAAPFNESILAFYLNDTIRLGSFTLTPGLRYDHLSVADDEVSPSLGLTYRLSEVTLLRAAVARGFRKPPIDVKEGDPAFHSLNPHLKAESLWTYQAGAETKVIPFLWLKAALFRHEVEDTWVNDPLLTYRNSGSSRRTGLEAEVKTVPLHDFSFGINYTFVRLDPAGEAASDDLYEVNLLLEYENKGRGLQALLAGHYVWWSDTQFAPPGWNGEFNDFLWDFTLHQRLTTIPLGEPLLFFKISNLFQNDQFFDEALPNAPRWMEAGLKLRF